MTKTGTVYILMLDKPIGSARHCIQFYTGFTSDLSRRLKDHRQGRGCNITRVAKERGIGFRVVYTEEGTRADEKRIKRRKGVRKFLKSRGITV